MKQRLLLLSLLMACVICVRAADKQNTLFVLTKGNVLHQFVLADKPKVTFEGTSLKVTCENNASASYTFNLSDVVRFAYDAKSATGIDEIQDETAGISQEGDVLVISQVKAGATVSVFALDGKLVRQLKPQRSGTYRLNLSELPSGLYIVKADNITYKITKP